MGKQHLLAVGKTLVHQQLAEWDQHCSLLEGREVWAVAMAAKVLLGQQCQRNRTLGTHMEKKLQEKQPAIFAISGRVCWVSQYKCDLQMHITHGSDPDLGLLPSPLWTFISLSAEGQGWFQFSYP